MKTSVLGSLAVGMMAGSAFAGSSYTITPMGGSVGSQFENGDMSGYSYNFVPNGGPAGFPPPGNLYDNVPTFLGGQSDPGFFGPFGSIPGTYQFWDFNNPLAQWGDDLHRISAGGAGPAVLTSLWYGYFLQGAAGTTSTHHIKIYDMFPPSVDHLSGIPTVPTGTAHTVQKGLLLTTLTVNAVNTVANAAYFVTVAVPSITLPHSAVWVKYESIDGANARTFWLNGGYPGKGNSHDGWTFSLKADDYNIFIPAPFLGSGTAYNATNITIGLGGFHIPGPAAISLLGLGGLVALRRRRAR